MRRPPTLVVWSMLVGLAVTAFVALGFGWLVSQRMIDNALHDAVRAAADQVSAAITPLVTPEDFGDPTPESVGAWQRRLHGMVGGEVARVKVWNAAGEVVYSDNPALIGRFFPLAMEDELRGALSTKRPASDFSALRRDEGAGERPTGRLMEIYVPVTLPGSSRAIGAYEVYRKMAPLQAQIDDIRQFVWRTAAAAFGLLFASLCFIVNNAGRRVIQQQGELRGAFVGTVRALVSAVDCKDSYTANHSSFVAEYAVTTARALGLSDEHIEDIRMAAYLHDLGKIGIPDEVLQKPSALTPEEERQMRRHPTIATHILEAVPFSRRIKLAVRHNHERWDGTGYPDGLAGEEIPLEARILGVADAYEAMTSNRPYQRTMDPATAIDELKRHAGMQFDPRVVAAFLRALAHQRRSTVGGPFAAAHANPSSAV